MALTVFVGVLMAAILIGAPIAYALIDSLTSRLRRRSAARHFSEDAVEAAHPVEVDPQLVG